MSISFGSINTGLPKDIVKQLMEAERIPLKSMEVRKEKLAEKKGLVDELTGLVQAAAGTLSNNINARSLREFKAEYNDKIVDIAIDKNIAEPGSYQFEVVQLARKSSAMSSGFADKDESNIGVGFIQYYLPNGEKRDIYIDSENSSLTKVAKLINSDPENGLTATVVDDGSDSETPWRLILSLKETGDENFAEFPFFYFVDGEDDFYLEFEREAQDAVVKLDGFEIELPENKATDLIPGLTIDLKKADPGNEFTIKIDEDGQAIAEKIDTLIEQVNAVLQFIKEQNTLDESSDTSRTLGGDITLQSLESRIRGVVFKSIPTQFGNRRLGDIGITFQRDGLLKLDSAKLETVLSENYQQTAQILVGYFNEEGQKVKGFMDNLRETVDLVLRVPDGLLKSRARSLRTNMDQIDRRIAQKERTLAQKEKNLKDKFARLEGTIARIKNQGAGISALGGQAGNSIVQQLG